MLSKHERDFLTHYGDNTGLVDTMPDFWGYVNKVVAEDHYHFHWNTGKITGMVAWQIADAPTGERFLIEKVLFASPVTTKRLIRHLEDTAKLNECTAILAGASISGFEERAARMYANAGFRTTYSFRKDL